MRFLEYAAVCGSVSEREVVFHAANSDSPPAASPEVFMIRDEARDDASREQDPCVARFGKFTLER